MTRGLVLSLNQQQIVNRARFLAGEIDLSALDSNIDLSTLPGGYDMSRGAAQRCADIYYLLQEHNGGSNPLAVDPADRWYMPGGHFLNRTADCVAGAAWDGGWDRFQPVRFAHLYDGSINTNSMILDALGPARCFIRLLKPEPGCYVVAPTGALGFEVCGHIGTVIEVPDDFEYDNLAGWLATKIVDIAFRTPARANQRSHAGPWFRGRDQGKGGLVSIFAKSIMVA